MTTTPRSDSDSLWEYGVVGVDGRMVNNGDYRVQQTHRRRKAGPWELVPAVPVLPTEPEEADVDPDAAFELGRIAGYDEAMREVHPAPTEPKEEQK